MNKIHVIFSKLVLSLILTGCHQDVVDEILIQEDRVSLVQRGAVIFEYDGGTCQLSYNANRHEFKAMDDAMAHYFIFKADADISEVGQEVVAELQYTTQTDIRSEKGLVFRVEKIDQSSGVYWLWCPARKIGVVVRKI